MSLTLAVAAPPSWSEQSRSVFEFLRTRYLSGDEDPYIVAFPNYEAFRRAKNGLFDEVARQPDRFEPSRPAVMLDLGLWVLERRWPEGPSIIQAARANVVRRSTPPGVDGAEDAFERLFHRTAVASLVSAQNLVAARDYILETERRVGSASARGRLADPRWEFIKAWLDEFQSAPNVSDSNSDEIPTLLSTTSGRRHQVLRLAADGFKRAMEHREAAGEATVRYAFSRHRLGDHETAAAALARLTPDDVAGDPAVDYWRAIVGGRVHEALGQPDAAEREYRQAIARWTGAQTPLVALASLLERRGQSSEANRVADRVRALPDHATDPWWFYWSADRRFLKDWRKRLREARP